MDLERLCRQHLGTKPEKYRITADVGRGPSCSALNTGRLSFGIRRYSKSSHPKP